MHRPLVLEVEVGDPGVPVVVRGGGGPRHAVLLLQLGLDPQLFHLVHLGNALAEVLHKLGSAPQGG